MSGRRKTTKRGFALSFAAVLCVACSTAPRATASNSAPDWLRTAAQQKLPSYPNDTNAVILLDEIQTTVQDKGEIYTRHRKAIRLLRPESKRNYGDIIVPFDKETKIVSLRVWTITSAGHELAVGDKDASERGFSNDEIYEDVKFKVLEFPEAEPGSVVGYEYVQRDRPYMLEDGWWFQRDVPVKTARFVLQLPPGWEFSTNWFNFTEQKPQTPAPNQYVWELSDLAAVERERDMPPWESVAGWVGIKYFPRDPALRAKTSGSWKDIGLWFDGLTQNSRTASPEIKQKVVELTAGIPNPVQKMRALTEYVQRNIRYYAVEIGIGGYQPHPAAEVFARQYGDCKDKATLLSTMLKEAGIDSYYVVIDDRRGVVHANYPSIGEFNHVIIAIRIGEQATDPSLYAEVNDPQLGWLLFFDPTNPYVPLGYIPSYLQDSYALVVAPDGGHLVSLPLLPPLTNRLLRTAKFTLTPVGDLSGEVQELRWGGPAADDREEFLETEPSKRAQIFENFLGDFLNNFALMGASLGNLDKYSDVFTLDYKFSSQGYAKVAGDLLVFPPRVVGDESTNLLDLFAVTGKPRKYPLEFEEATRQDDVFDFVLPAGYVVDGLPQPVQADCEYATYRSQINAEGGVLHYKRSFEIKNIVVPTEKLPEIRSFLREIAADQGSSAVLRRAAP
jgi:transglutaminase-like putative cysteine protease